MRACVAALGKRSAGSTAGAGAGVAAARAGWRSGVGVAATGADWGAAGGAAAATFFLAHAAPVNEITATAKRTDLREFFMATFSPSECYRFARVIFHPVRT